MTNKEHYNSKYYNEVSDEGYSDRE
ncbi:a91520d4-dce7-4f7d-88b1-0d8495202248 [Thermothielavioides terrestris]|uniref:A91520d4-dce7-4f7d-88b1-0d8495202248 n=1 Tax=Thermothielavioides terrestris TaxID=2587410 RepID=A0A446BQH8_9PEZI|nr:a91520d4-dce7-4f7d-88b1-0d8495202248 [Thermothielavioides terrestris]